LTLNLTLIVHSGITSSIAHRIATAIHLSTNALNKHFNKAYLSLSNNITGLDFPECGTELTGSIGQYNAFGKPKIKKSGTLKYIRRL